MCCEDNKTHVENLMRIACEQDYFLGEETHFHKVFPSKYSTGVAAELTTNGGDFYMLTISPRGAIDFYQDKKPQQKHMRINQWPLYEYMIKHRLINLGETE